MLNNEKWLVIAIVLMFVTAMFERCGWADILGAEVQEEFGTYFIETEMRHLYTSRQCFRAAIELSNEGGL